MGARPLWLVNTMGVMVVILNTVAGQHHGVI